MGRETGIPEYAAQKPYAKISSPTAKDIEGGGQKNSTALRDLEKKKKLTFSSGRTTRALSKSGEKGKIRLVTSGETPEGATRATNL